MKQQPFSPSITLIECKDTHRGLLTAVECITELTERSWRVAVIDGFLDLESHGSEEAVCCTNLKFFSSCPNLIQPAGRRASYLSTMMSQSLLSLLILRRLSLRLK